MNNTTNYAKSKGKTGGVVGQPRRSFVGLRMVPDGALTVTRCRTVANGFELMASTPNAHGTGDNAAVGCENKCDAFSVDQPRSECDRLTQQMGQLTIVGDMPTCLKANCSALVLGPDQGICHVLNGENVVVDLGGCDSSRISSVQRSADAGSRRRGVRKSLGFCADYSECKEDTSRSTTRDRAKIARSKRRRFEERGLRTGKKKADVDVVSLARERRSRLHADSGEELFLSRGKSELLKALGRPVNVFAKYQRTGCKVVDNATIRELIDSSNVAELERLGFPAGDCMRQALKYVKDESSPCKEDRKLLNRMKKAGWHSYENRLPDDYQPYTAESYFPVLSDASMSAEMMRSGLEIDPGPSNPATLCPNEGKVLSLNDEPRTVKIIKSHGRKGFKVCMLCDLPLTPEPNKRRFRHISTSDCFSELPEVNMCPSVPSEPPVDDPPSGSASQPSNPTPSSPKATASGPDPSSPPTGSGPMGPNPPNGPNPPSSSPPSPPAPPTSSAPTGPVPPAPPLPVPGTNRRFQWQRRHLQHTAPLPPRELPAPPLPTNSEGVRILPIVSKPVCDDDTVHSNRPLGGIYLSDWESMDALMRNSMITRWLPRLGLANWFLRGAGHLTRQMDMVQYKSNVRPVTCRGVHETKQSLELETVTYSLKDREFDMLPVMLVWAVVILGLISCGKLGWSSFIIVPNMLVMLVLVLTIRRRRIGHMMLESLTWPVAWILSYGIRRSKLWYCPHMVTCVAADFDTGANEKTIVSNVSSKMRRLGTLPLADHYYLQVVYGSVQAVLSVLRNRNFMARDVA